jgi:NAD(P)-dependent dehydrogenase (short-subunit alcohol dehydrogenase family)
VTDIDPEAAARVAAEVGGEPHRLDVADEEQVQHTVAAIAQRHGGIDILVNNAGLGARMPSVEMPTDRWRQVMAVNVDGGFFCARETGRHMVAAGKGAVVNIASIMGLVGGHYYPNLAYHTAKGALVNFTRALACEWGPHGVRVNAVAPTFARTRLTEPLLADKDMERRLLDHTPMGRMVERCRGDDHRCDAAGRWGLDRPLRRSSPLSRIHPHVSIPDPKAMRSESAPTRTTTLPGSANSS